MTRDRYLEAAVLAADWLADNQVKDELDANRGRVLEVFDGKSGRFWYSRNWVTGLAALALLAAHSATGSSKYLEAAKLAGEYIKSLHFLDPSKALFGGTFREITPQSTWAHPRDAVSAAWGLLGLHRVTGDDDCLERAGLFADWYLTRAMTRGYPAWTAGIAGEDWNYLLGGFQCGGAAFFCDLYRVTGKRHYLDSVAKPICQRFLELFLKDDGSLRTVIDPETGEDLTDKELPVFPLHMHRMCHYNDDFSSVALIKAYRDSGDERFLEGAGRFLRRLAREQNKDGSLGSPPVVSACGTGILEWCDMDDVTSRDEFSGNVERAADFLLARQEGENENPRLRGGVYGLDLRGETDQRSTVNSRSTIYAILAWIRASGAARFNPISISAFA